MDVVSMCHAQTEERCVVIFPACLECLPLDRRLRGKDTLSSAQQSICDPNLRSSGPRLRCSHLLSCLGRYLRADEQ